MIAFDDELGVGRVKGKEENLTKIGPMFLTGQGKYYLKQMRKLGR